MSEVVGKVRRLMCPLVVKWTWVVEDDVGMD